MGTARRAYDLMRGYVNKEWDRISQSEGSSAQRELDEAMAATPVPTAPIADPIPTMTMQERARSILGLASTATFADIRRSFERLNRRSDPKNFPPGSVEAIKAAEIQKQIHWAYGTLTEGMDTTEKRFRSLEIE